MAASSQYKIDAIIALNIKKFLNYFTKFNRYFVKCYFFKYKYIDKRILAEICIFGQCDKIESKCMYIDYTICFNASSGPI